MRKSQLRIAQRSLILDHKGRAMMSSGEQRGQVFGYMGGEDAFKGASSSRREGALWQPGSDSADSAVSYALPQLRYRSSDLIRNCPVAAGAVETLENHVVGTGLYCQPSMDNGVLNLTDDALEALEETFKREFNLWGSTVECDVRRRNNWDGLQQLAFWSWHERGDVGCSLPMFLRAGSVYETKLQLIEADRISNPMGKFNTKNLVNGVEMDDYGAPLAYHVLRNHPGDIFLPADFFTADRREAFGAETGRRNFWLLGDDHRVGQTRGLPYLTVVMQPLKQTERYTDAELAAAIVGGSFTVFIKSEEDGDFMPLASTPFNQFTTDASGDTDYALDYGSIIPLRPGESIEQADPKRPNAAFDGFLKSNFEQIGVGLGIPYELLMKHFTASYSASRAALLEGRQFFLKKRGRFSLNFCQPVYESVVTEAVLKGRLRAPGFFDDPMKRIAYLGVNWIGPSEGQINALAEAQGAELRIAMGVSSLAIETPAMTGQDWRDVHKQRARELKARIKEGLEIDPKQALKTIAPKPDVSGT